VAIAVRSPVARTFALISPTSHHGQWSRASFKSCGEERWFLSQLAKDQKSKLSSSAPHSLYHRGKQKRPFGTHGRDSAQRARHLGLFAIQAAQHPTHSEWGLSPHVSNVDLPGVARQQGRRAITPTILGRVCGLCSSTE
jgi:hypothetical protein